jgi:hypothetical protein
MVNTSVLMITSAARSAASCAAMTTAELSPNQAS